MRNDIQITIAPQLDHLKDEQKFVWLSHFETPEEFDKLMERIKAGYQDFLNEKLSALESYSQEQTRLQEELNHNPELIKRLIYSFPFWKNIDQFDSDETILNKLIEFAKQRKKENAQSKLPANIVATIVAMDDEDQELGRTQAEFTLNTESMEYTQSSPDAVIEIKTDKEDANVKQLMVCPLNSRNTVILKFDKQGEGIHNGMKLTLNDTKFSVMDN